MKLLKVISAFALIGVMFTSCNDDKKKEAEKKAEMEQMEAKKMQDSMDAEKMRMDERDAMAVMVGGAKMYPDMTIVANASNSKEHTTLVAAVKAAGLVETLNGAGPYTVFAPTDAAFAKLPAGTVESLLKPEMKDKLSGLLTYHVVAGNIMAADLMKMIEEGKGKASITTVNGEKLTAMVVDGKVQLKDAKGNVSTVTTADVKQSNGVIHVVDTVLMPAK